MATLVGGFLDMLNHVVGLQYLPEPCGASIISILEVEVEIPRQDEITWYTCVSL